MFWFNAFGVNKPRILDLIYIYISIYIYLSVLFVDYGDSLF